MSTEHSVPKHWGADLTNACVQGANYEYVEGGPEDAPWDPYADDEREFLAGLLFGALTDAAEIPWTWP